MSRTVAQGFECFHDTLKTSPAETEAAKSHRRSIDDCLKNNFGNGTNIKDHSDVDYLAHLPSKVITNTSTALRTKVKDVLTTRFPNTGVKISTPAVVCSFGRLKSEDTEVVVAKYVKDKSGFKVYHIVGGNGGWMEVSPDFVPPVTGPVASLRHQSYVFSLLVSEISHVSARLPAALTP